MCCILSYTKSLMFWQRVEMHVTANGCTCFFTLLPLLSYNISKNHNRIGNDGALALGNMLKDNTTIVELYLSENKIGNEGAISLADGLKVNSTIVKLNLSKFDNK